MIEYKKQPSSKEELLRILNPTIQKWFFSRFRDFSLPQLYAVTEIHSRNNVVVSAPTGATKTLTGFLSVLNELVDSAEKGVLKDKTYCIYISPLKALNNDIEKNLKEPLEEIERIAGKKLGIRVGVRTGDTTQKAKNAMLKNPPHILITTPESLAIMLSSIKMADHLKSVEWMIIDEIHALAENKRGVHLSLLMEMLQHVSSHITRVGLSATVAPLESIAAYLVGPSRPCKIVDVQYIKQLDLKVLSPVDDLINTDYKTLHTKQYELLNNLIQKHKTTLIFTNTRAATERVVHFLKDRFPKNYAELGDEDNPNGIGAHHGSLSKEHRLKIETNLRDGKLKCVVCSTSLELGLDIGYIDLVILLGSPKSVARMLQRIGRSGHQLHSTTKGRIVVLGRDDLVECSVMLKNAMEKKIDRIHIPENALDVLAQVIVGNALQDVWDEEELYAMIRRSYCYQNLDHKEYVQILEYLAGEYVSLEDRYIYAKIWRKDGKLGRKGKMGRVIYMTNIGTIPDNSFVLVKIGDQVVGKIDESFLERLKPGDVFILGGDTYQFRHAKGQVAQVSSSVNRPPTVPSWYSDTLPLSFDLAVDIGKFRRLIQQRIAKKESRDSIISWIHEYLYVDETAAKAIYNYMKEQFDYVGLFPTDKTILLEQYHDERGDSKIIFHTLYGRRVNECLSRAIGFAIGRVHRRNVEIGINDNGFYINSRSPINMRKILGILKSEKIEMVLNVAIDNSEVMKRRFRHCAARALMILRNYKGQTKRVGKQQVSSMILMAALKRIDQQFSILKEARREVLHDLMDVENTKKIFADIESGKIKIETVQTSIPSPFAFQIALQGHMDVLKMEDRVEFLRRMHEMVMGKIAIGKGQASSQKPFSIQEYMAQAHANKVEPSQLQQALLRQLDRVNLPQRTKLDFMNVIRDNQELSPGQRNFIMEANLDDWPEELRSYLENKVKNPDFSYGDLWSEQDREEKEEALVKIENLKLDLKRAAQREKLDPQIVYDLFEMIDGKEEPSREETKVFIQELLTGTVPKVWSDDLVRFLGKFKNIR